MSYRVDIKTSALRALEKIPKAFQSRILDKVTNLGISPRPAGCSKLAGGGNLWRVRMGDYRIVYVVDDARKTVDIRIIAHRREVYRDV